MQYMTFTNLSKQGGESSIEGLSILTLKVLVTTIDALGHF